MIKINLLDFRRMKRVMQIQKELALYLALIVLALGFIIFLSQKQSSRIKQVNGEITHWKMKLEKIKKTVKKVDEAEKKKKRVEHILKSIKILKDHQTEPARLLDDININLPSEVWLTNFEETKTIALLGGYSFSDPAIAAFMKKLEGLPAHFTGIELIETRQVVVSGEKVKKFSIRCIKKPKASPTEAKKT